MLSLGTTCFNNNLQPEIRAVLESIEEAIY